LQPEREQDRYWKEVPEAGEAGEEEEEEEEEEVVVEVEAAVRDQM